MVVVVQSFVCRLLFGLYVYIKSEIISELNAFWVYLFSRGIFCLLSIFHLENLHAMMAAKGRDGWRINDDDDDAFTVEQSRIINSMLELKDFII